jgi:hypothetical protein
MRQNRRGTKVPGLRTLRRRTGLAKRSGSLEASTVRGLTEPGKRF